MEDVYRTPKRPKLNCCSYANKIIAELENTREYPLSVAEEISRIETFLPKDNIGTKPLSDESLQDMIDSREYPLTVDEELSHIGAFRTFLPKDKGAQAPSDESLQDMIDSGDDFFDIPELPLRFLNYESKIFKSKRFSHK